MTPQLTWGDRKLKKVFPGRRLTFGYRLYHERRTETYQMESIRTEKSLIFKFFELSNNKHFQKNLRLKI